ncbi:hypothetical protein MLD38_034078 [Melastoma candidum]|uniref:Uncharacterized protein n=1 Tax=Melastoma candidum TaxID=119954 RepID=A0ACB9M9B7_9MYRT|nr:hypothetical protein MLD38_034078 [Melastoma candidum]
MLEAAANPTLVSDSVSTSQKKKKKHEGGDGGGIPLEAAGWVRDVPHCYGGNGRGRYQLSSRRVTPAVVAESAPAAVEKALTNGDLYIGSFSRNVPHGSGKYLWSNGCMYEGEWRHGKASGKGRFPWPFRGTFEGEFKSGRMDGFGTFVGSDGDSYRGSWNSDLTHGYGEERYANGDYFKGTWKRDVQDGQGRYVWSNGNEYDGDWRNGVISGRGTLTWSNGNRYEGQWENNVPKGNGVFTRLDGSDVMTWNKDLSRNGEFSCGEEGKEVCLIKDSLVLSPAMRKKSTSSAEGFGQRESFGGAGERNSLPRICIWESDGEAGDITCEIIDNLEAAMFYSSEISGFGDFKKSSPCCYPTEAKKPGQTISKGHKNYDLMLNLQLGIMHSVGNNSCLSSRELKPTDFDPKEKFWTRFPPEGSKNTPPHSSVEFRWKDYCPMVFRQLRELFQVDPADYMLAVCGNDALRELSSPGKSGSFFYLTQDSRFMIKTVKKSEVKVLIRMLPSYYQHVRQHENSLVTKFFGVHCVKPTGGQKTRFIVMANLFCSEYQIHRRFDLKGSSHGRTTIKTVEKIDETTTLKDLDLDFFFRLKKSWFQDLIIQIELDCEFLETEGIMDYSLLVGLHFRNDNAGDKMGLSPFVLRSGKKDSYQNEKFLHGCLFLEAELQDMDRRLPGRKPLIRLGANMPARAERMGRWRNFDQYLHLTPPHCCETYEVILYFGIIDILQDYDISKKLEHAYKSLQANPASISAVDPKQYSKRFRDFIGRIFIEEER